ncbi:MAG: hypothetical protein RR139_10170 [Lachnospiraceae bacterium]
MTLFINHLYSIQEEYENISEKEALSAADIRYNQTWISLIYRGEYGRIGYKKGH